MTLTIEFLHVPPLAWLILLSPFIAFWFAGIASHHLRESFMITSPFGVSRRWFGLGCRVAVRAGAWLSDPWEVIAWENTEGPVFVKIRRRHGDRMYMQWLPVTQIAPVSVLVFRPRVGRRGITLTAQRPVSAGSAS